MILEIIQALIEVVIENPLELCIGGGLAVGLTLKKKEPNIDKQIAKCQKKIDKSLNKAKKEAAKKEKLEEQKKC